MQIPNTEAKVCYKDSDYDIIQYGSYVTCAVTGEKIDLDALKYWSVDRQEAYKDCETYLKSEIAHTPRLRNLL